MQYFGPTEHLTIVARGFLASALRSNKRFEEALAEWKLCEFHCVMKSIATIIPYAIAG